MRLHKNIKVIRHPNYIVIPFFWSHHEKIVLIDQRIAFIGGLDICYGRWDTSEHPLTNDKNLWSGADFCNLRITDIYFPRNFMMCSLDPRTQPRMPWHDVAVQLRGSSVHDLARHFTTYWNFVNSQMNFDDSELLTLSGRQPTYHFQSKNESVSERDNKILPMLSERKDTSDLEEVLVDNLIEEEYYEKYLNENVLKVGSLNIPRMHVIKENIKNMPKKFIGFITESREEGKCLIVANENEDSREGTSSSHLGRYKHQFLRSSATWSQGLMQKEHSIYNAYLHLIETAEHFIYIENQFFICKENLIV
jgi:phospholipase D1/2